METQLTTPDRIIETVENKKPLSELSNEELVALINRADLGGYPEAEISRELNKTNRGDILR